MNRLPIFQKISLKQLMVAIALISVFLIIFSYTYFYKLRIDFAALNGSYQTFNPIRRVLDGETPSVDFNLYLGIGTTYVTALLTFLTGKNFAASHFSNAFLHLVGHFLVWFALLYLVGLSSRKALLAASGITGLITLIFGSVYHLGDPPLRRFLEGVNAPFTSSLPLLAFLTELTHPGLSNLGLRSALPFLTALILLLAHHGLSQKPIWLVMICGVLVGMQPLWSNDYGFISALVLTLTAIAYILKQRHPGWQQAILLLVLSSVLSFWGILSLISRGDPTVWIQENVLGVAGDQFWYYLGTKVFELSDIFPEPFLYYYLGILALFCLYVILSPANLRYALLTYIALTTFGAGILSSVGGASAMRYFIPTLFVSYFVIAFCLWTILKKLIPIFLKSDSKQWHCSSLLERWTAWKSPLIRILTFLVISFYGVGIAVAIDRIPSPPKPANYFYVDQLGGWLSKSFGRGVDIANEIESQTRELPPEKRILSTYASMIDVLAGSKNVTGVDYIIHALGEQTRQRYRDRFLETKPEFITTLRVDYSNWENWVRRVNWWFYREFLTAYQPIDATFYNLIWKRLETPITPPNVDISCTIQPQANNSVNLVFSSQLPSTNVDQFNSPYYVDVALDYALTVKSSGVPLIGKRGLVTASEIAVGTKKGLPVEGASSYGLPPKHPNWHVPLIYRVGETSVLNLTGAPAERATLQVSSCKAQLLVPESRFELIRQTRPKNLTSDRWKNGIAVGVQPGAPSQAGFVFERPVAGEILLPRMTVEFARGGSREVVAVQGDAVWVTGDALDPVQDGYPQPVVLKMK